ncbi:anti-sigma factor [Patulibacter brassicae]|uniref:Regulator of SigK n=1 Tax=Patulibacter brassicae TaxID=1705717 RepID=A0ABU4VGM9_9ACTN|nr:anti-sigma factor [Patulibacter brassicae]MDX8150966.1 anti-sigma factor [Patulibacter brassicae]
MSCRQPEMAELLGAYVLGACPEPERALVAQHLVDCAACREQVRSLQPVTAALLEEPAAPPPSPEVKRAVMARVREEASLFAAAGPGGVPQQPRPADLAALGDLTAMPGAVPPADGAETAEAPPSGSRRAAFLAALRSPTRVGALAAVLVALVVAGVTIGGAGDVGEDARGTTVAQAEITRTIAPRGSGHVAVHAGRAHVEVAGLPAAPRGHEYQVWVVSGERAPRPTSALFSVDGRGRASVDLPGTVNDYDQVMITDEPHGGSRVPTGRVVFRAEV